MTGLQAGDAAYGVTNAQFVGAHAEYAVCQADLIAAKPAALAALEAASAPVIGVTAHQMLFEHAEAR